MTTSQATLKPYISGTWAGLSRDLAAVDSESARRVSELDDDGQLPENEHHRGHRQDDEGRCVRTRFMVATRTTKGGPRVGHNRGAGPWPPRGGHRAPRVHAAGGVPRGAHGGRRPRRRSAPREAFPITHGYGALPKQLPVGRRGGSSHASLCCGRRQGVPASRPPRALASAPRVQGTPPFGKIGYV